MGFLGAKIRYPDFSKSRAALSPFSSSFNFRYFRSIDSLV